LSGLAATLRIRETVTDTMDEIRSSFCLQRAQGVFDQRELPDPDRPLLMNAMLISHAFALTTVPANWKRRFLLTTFPVS
jgi:hypothetical protein